MPESSDKAAFDAAFEARAGNAPVMPDWSDLDKLALTCRMLAADGHESGVAGQITCRPASPIQSGPCALAWALMKPPVAHSSVSGRTLKRWRARARRIRPPVFISGCTGTCPMCNALCTPIRRMCRRCPCWASRWLLHTWMQRCFMMTAPGLKHGRACRLPTTRAASFRPRSGKSTPFCWPITAFLPLAAPLNKPR